jgi:hypothetical protein
VLREDNRAIIRAASAASKAADYLLTFRTRDLDAPDPAGDAPPLRSPEDPANPSQGSPAPPPPSGAGRHPSSSGSTTLSN